MIKQLTLRNFKGWQALENLELGNITVLFGANSSGKTSVMQSLLMLKQTTESYDRKRALHFGGGQKDYVDLGSFEELIYGHEPDSRTLGIEAQWEPVELPDFGDGRAFRGDLHYRAAWEYVQGEVALTQLRYAIANRTMGLTRQTEGGYEPEISGFTRRRGRPWQLVGPESCYALPLRARREVQKADPLEFNRQFELLMERIAYLGPLREFPRRLYTWTGEKPRTMDRKGSNALDILVAATIEHVRNGSNRGKRRIVPLIEQLGEWLGRLGLSDDFLLSAIDAHARVYTAQLRPPSAPSTAIITDVGFGVSQVLPVVVMLLTVPERSVVMLEQPEIHLHPAVQANLADLFLSVAHERSLQLIIESHSEHLLRRLQRRIAEHKEPLANPDHLKLYFCSLGDQGCKIEHVRTDLFGNIENWPEGFFGSEVEDLEAMTRAQIRRKKEAAARA